MNVPLGYGEARSGNARIIARADVLGVVRQAIERHGTLYDYAATRHDVETLQGRGILRVIPGPGRDRWVVRRLTHGGLLAPLTGDRFLRLGTPRPFNELRLAVELEALGVPTPPVVAASAYFSGPFYRGEVAREEIREASDLAACLFGAKRAGPERRGAALAETGRLIAHLHRAGVIHPDLNLRNVLISWSAGPARAYILDLEKCRRVDHPSPADRQRMIARLEHSARRFEQRTGDRMSRDDWEIFETAYSASV